MATQNSGITNTAFGSNLLANTSVKAPNYSQAKAPTDPTQPFKISLGGPQKDPSKPEFTNSYRYPSDPGIDATTDYVMFNFYEYEPPFKNFGGVGTTALEQYNQSAMTYNPVSGLKQVMLYMPEDISTGYKTNWTGKNFGNTAADIMRTVGQDNLGSALAKGVQSAVQGFEQIAPVAKAKTIQSVVGGITGEQPSLDDIFSSTRGVIFNPNTELLFQGFDLRNFTLSFKLVPRNQKEANMIEGILYTFKKAMLPSFSSGKELNSTTDEIANITTGGLLSTIPGLSTVLNEVDNEGFKANYIKVPKLVQVNFMSGSEKNKHVPQYKMCALTQMDVNYTPDGVYATTRDGRMVAYQLSLNFQETKLIFAEEAGSY
jgi:Tail-tube assembly protein